MNLASWSLILKRLLQRSKEKVMFTKGLTTVTTSAKRHGRMIRGLILFLLVVCGTSLSYARDVEYKGGETTVRVNAGEPTRIEFPSEIQGGFMKQLTAVHVDRKDNDLIVFASADLPPSGEAIIVRLKDGRSYSLRIEPASIETPRDAVVRIYDERSAYEEGEELEKAYEEGKHEYAPPSKVSGLMREMVLAAEFGKDTIPGYKVTERHKGETVLDDGAMTAKVDRIFVGPNLWGYVLDAENNLDQTLQINPASFRLDGTRAVSVTNWELSPRPYTVEQQIARKHQTKVYIITRPKQLR